MKVNFLLSEWSIKAMLKNIGEGSVVSDDIKVEIVGEWDNW